MGMEYLGMRIPREGACRMPKREEKRGGREGMETFYGCGAAGLDTLGTLGEVSLNRYED